MAIRRFKATKDTTITNAFKANLTNRGSGSNMGASDILEVFSIYGQASTSSSELSRILIDFDIAAVSSSRDDGGIPASGSVNFYLKMFNAEHSSTTATDYVLQIAALSQSWNEGFGLDMEDYKDPGIGNGGQGCTWQARTSGSYSEGSLNLDSSGTEYVSVSDNSAFTFSDATTDSNGTTDKPFSISAWIYVDDLSADRPILSKFTTSGGNKREWYFYVRGTDGLKYLELQLYDEANDKQQSARTATETIATARWYHAVVTYDGRGGGNANSGITFYIDGVESGATLGTTDAAYALMRNTTAAVQIGALSYNSNYFDGQMDEISVWSKELASYEVKEMYNKGVPNNLTQTNAYTIDTTSKLTAWWRMEYDNVVQPDTTTTIYDRSGNGYNGAGQNLDAADLLTSNYAGIGKDNVANTALYWLNEGGTLLTGTQNNFFSQQFNTGIEDLEVDVTTQIEGWLNNRTSSYGFAVLLSGSYEAKERSYYTKKFFGRDSQYVLKRPVLEARWDGSKGDDATNFYLSSSRAPAAENLNTLFLYNFVRGQLKNIPDVDTGVISLSVYSGSADGSGPTGEKLSLPKGGGIKAANHNSVTGGYVETGVYSASFAYTSSAITEIYPVWFSGSTEYLTASAVSVKTLDEQRQYPTNIYTTNITNLQPQYSTNDLAHLRVFVRNRDWSPNIYTVASPEIESTIVENLYYKVIRAVDEQIVINYGTGSGEQAYTKLSYDASGSYFDLDMSIFETDFSYQVSFLMNQGSDYVELKDKFNFRVVDENDIPG